MRTIEILISEDDARTMGRRIEQGGFASASEYITELIRRDCRRSAAQERLDKLLLEGLESGEPIAMTKEWWESTRTELAARLHRD